MIDSIDDKQLESMIFSTKEIIQEETQKLIKENNLTYGEARGKKS